MLAERQLTPHEGVAQELVERVVPANIFAVNLKSAFVLSKRGAVSMIARRAGSIINVASVAGTKPAPGLGAYGRYRLAVEQQALGLPPEEQAKVVKINANVIHASAFHPTNAGIAGTMLPESITVRRAAVLAQPLGASLAIGIQVR